jgi:AmmeMemoRadiSam system protein A
VGFPPVFTLEEKRELLVIARKAIASALEGKPLDTALPDSASLLQPRGAFVTIRIDRQLRGCIGYIESPRPLAQVVAEVATKASLEDPRFPPLALAELEHATLEISVLSPLCQVKDPEEIEVGTHGLLLELGMNRGLLLPQVAVEYQWDRQAFLEATARKAGLHKSAWLDPEARIYAFSAEIVQEEDVMEKGVA